MSIAEKLTIIANNTTDVFVSGYNTGYAEGEEVGFNDGLAEGWVDNENMVVSELENPVQKVESYGVGECTVVDSVGMIRYIDENIPNVYNKGVHDGVADGRQAEYDEFWDAYQNYGSAKNYSYAFYRHWTRDSFRPKYDIICSGSTSAVFEFFEQGEEPLDFAAKLEELGIRLDTSAVTTSSEVFYYTSFSRLPHVDLSDARTATRMFGYSFNLITIDKITSNENLTWVDAFLRADVLENVIFEGVIGNDINFQYSPLSKDSITSVVNALSGTASGKTVTFKESAVTDAFGSTTAQEWLDLTATKSSWTISLV